MLNLLEKDIGIERGRSISPSLALAHNKRANSIERVVMNYRSNLVTIDRNHPIYRLVYTMRYLNPNVPIDPFTYYSKARTNMDTLALGVGITTSNNKIEMGRGNFYGNIFSAMVLSDSIQVGRLNSIASDWENCKPLNVLTCPILKGVYSRPDLIKASKGFAVISVDIPMLSVMYNIWEWHNQKKPIDSQEGIDAFIGNYVFPNMMYSQADAVNANLLNMVDYDLFDDDPTLPVTPIAITDNNDQYVSELSDFVNEFGKLGFTMLQAAENIPGFLGDSFQDSLIEIDDANTQTNYWAMALGALVAMHGLAFLTPTDPSATETMKRFNLVKRKIKTQRTFAAMPADASIIKTAQFLFDDLESLLGAKI